MCTNGINTGQILNSTRQIEESLALSRRWIHANYHLADSSQLSETAALLSKAQNLIDDARDLLNQSVDVAEKEAEAAGPAVTVAAV